MPGMAQGAHRGRPVAAAPCTPGLRPAKSPLRGPFDLSLQASGRAEAASVQNTALSPHPCGLPRPSGNVSAILRPSAPAVSATMVNKLTAGRTNRMPQGAACLAWRRERTGGGQSPPPPVPPGSGQQNRRYAVPSTYPCRLRVGPRQRPCKTRPSARIHAGCPGLPGTSQRF